MKRTDYINWDEYFMGIALLTAMRSKDPNSQVARASSARKTKFCPWATTVCPLAAATTRLPWEREGATAGHQVYVRVPRRAERHPQQRPQ